MEIAGRFDADVTIIGGGPAGSALAALLARRGVSVALVDRDLFPRDKLCGEFLSYDGLPVARLLGIESVLDAHGCPRITHCRIAGGSRPFEFALPEAARGISRRLFDETLFRLAASQGAVAFEGWTATSITAGAVTIEKDSEIRTLRSQVTVGAWGRWGRFDAQLGRPFARDHAHRNFGFKKHYAPLESRTDEDRSRIDLYSFGHGYLGVSPVEDGIVNICGLVHASRIRKLKGRWDAFVDEIRLESPLLDTLYSEHAPAQDGFLSSEPVVFRARSPVEQGIVMIGDASGIVDPLTGNGMSMAMQSALLAASHIVRLCGNGSDRTSIERTYVAAHRELFSSRIEWSRRLAALLTRPSLLNAAMSLAPSTAPGQFLVRRTRATGDQVSRLIDSWLAIS